MIKKILPISVFVLICVVIVLLGLQSMLSKNKSQGTSAITPTLIPGSQGGSYTPVNNSNNRTGTTASTTPLTPEELQKKLPIIAPDFTLNYSPRMRRYVVTVGSGEGATNSYNDWIAQNPSYVDELQNAIVTKQTLDELNAALDYAKKNELSPEKKAVQEAQDLTQNLSLLINLPFLFNQLPQLTPIPTLVPTIIPTAIPTGVPTAVPTPQKTTSNPSSGNYTYYSQCDGPYDSYPLPDGCTVCAMGCGPTSVAMILSSYIDKSLTPPETIDLMSKSGVYIGCNGSNISDIYSYLSSRGDLRLSDYIIPSGGSLSEQEVASDFAGYIKSGWTIFVLANFKVNGGAHFFWVTDVTENGDILAYDPYYGKQQSAPINENRYAPVPYYRYAFAVKKS